MRSRTGLLVIALLCACASADARNETRRVESGRIISSSLPAIEIEVKPPFRYVGTFPFQIADIAAGSRYVFADADGNRVKRLFIAQFEGFLPSSDEIYRYDFSNAMTLGGHRFRHNVGQYSTSALRAQAPGNEAALTHDFLTARGYEVDDELLMARFLTLGAEDRRSELILFYIENARGGTQEGIRERALSAFEIRSPSTRVR